jgi:hypothetical protein
LCATRGCSVWLFSLVADATTRERRSRQEPQGQRYHHRMKALNQAAIKSHHGGLDEATYASLTMNLCASPISSKDSLLTCQCPTNPQIHHPPLCSISMTVAPYLVEAPCTNLLNRNHQDPGENHHRCRHSKPYL